MNNIGKLSMKNKSGRLFLKTACAVSALVIASNSVNAAVWLFDPTITLSQEYDDNYRLESESSNEDEVSTTNLTGELALKGKSERLDVKALVRLDAIKYSGDDRNLSDRNNQLVSLSSNYKATEKNRFFLKSNLLRDTILRSARIIALPGDIDDDVALDPDEDIDVNIIQRNLRRKRFTLNTGWRYRIDERTNIGLGYRYKDLSFSGGSDSGLVESDRQTISANLTRKITEKDTITGKISESYFRPDNDGPDQDVDTLEARIGWIRDFSETLQMDFTFGGRESDFDNARKSSDSGFVANIGATKRTGLTTYRVNLERKVNPSASGNQAEVDELSIYVDRAITEKLSFNFDGRIFDTETTGNTNSASDREYISLSPSLKWRFSPSWVAGVSYRYTEEDRDNFVGGSADNNGAQVSISYSPPRQF